MDGEGGFGRRKSKGEKRNKRGNGEKIDREDIFSSFGILEESLTGKDTISVLFSEKKEKKKNR